MDREKIDFSNIPPNGVFYNRMSASSHTRGHRYAPEDTKIVFELVRRLQPKNNK